MRMIERDDRNARRLSERDRFPADLIWITRFDDVRLFALQDFADGAQIEQSAVTRRARDQRRTDRVNARTLTVDSLRFFTGNNEQMFVVDPVANVFRLLVDVPFHSTAER